MPSILAPRQEPALGRESTLNRAAILSASFFET